MSKEPKKSALARRLEPVDPRRCQVEITRWEPFRIGAPAIPQRCTKVPRWVIVEAKPGKDGHHGGMSVCETCMARVPAGVIAVELAND